MIHFIMKNVSLEKHTNATKVFSMAMCSGVNPASVRQCTLQPVGRGRGEGGEPEFLLVTVWGDETAAVWILCRQLMFISSAHLGLLTKHLAKLPPCARLFL